jgi:hypothetical protein
MKIEFDLDRRTGFAIRNAASSLGISHSTFLRKFFAAIGPDCFFEFAKHLNTGKHPNLVSNSFSTQSETQRILTFRNTMSAALDPNQNSTSVTEIDFSIHDSKDKTPLTPENIDLPTLRLFLTEVEELIRGGEPTSVLADSKVKIETGSVRVVAAVASILATSLLQDISRASELGDLSAIHPKRAKILQSWQARAASSSTSRMYTVQSRALPLPMRISSDTHLIYKNSSWVPVEKYITGKVYIAGGKSHPNIHLETDGPQNLLTIEASEIQLRSFKKLYEVMMVYVKAEQNIYNRHLRKIRLISFVEIPNQIDEDALRVLHEKGRKSWADVPSASDWVRDLRGDI